MNAFIALLALVGAQAYNTYGLTENQVLDMGRDKWMEFQASKAGNSTLAMVDGAETYGAILRKRNNAISDLSSDSIKTRLAKDVRSSLTDFGENGTDLAQVCAGGGSMYQILLANVGPDVEEIVHTLLLNNGEVPKHFVVSDVTTALKKVKAKISAEHKDPDAQSYFKYDSANHDYEKMESDFSKILTIAKRMKRDQSDRVLGFCVRYAETVFQN